jgi:hypothetical protein
MRVLPPAVASAIACPAFDASASFALFAPAATTAAIIDKIYRETVRSLAPIETRRRLDEIGMELLAIRGGLCSLLYFFSLDLAADCAHKNVKLRPRPHLRNRPNESHDPPQRGQELIGARAWSVMGGKLRVIACRTTQKFSLAGRQQRPAEAAEKEAPARMLGPVRKIILLLCRALGGGPGSVSICVPGVGAHRGMENRINSIRDDTAGAQQPVPAAVYIGIRRRHRRAGSAESEGRRESNLGQHF